MCSIQCRVITKDVKMVSVATLFGAQHYKAALGHTYCLALNIKRQSLDNAHSDLIKANRPKGVTRWTRP